MVSTHLSGSLSRAFPKLGLDLPPRAPMTLGHRVVIAVISVLPTTRTLSPVSAGSQHSSSSYTARIDDTANAHLDCAAPIPFTLL